MTYVDFGQSGLSDIERDAPPSVRREVDRSINRISRLGGYAALLAVSLALAAWVVGRLL